jgi:hypothetical protein
MLQDLMGAKDGWIFSLPVDYRALGLPDYPFVVPRPMDLSTLHRRLASGRHYQTIAAAAVDALRIFDNAMLYNPPGDPVRLAAARLRKVFLARWPGATAAPGLSAGGVDLTDRVVMLMPPEQDARPAAAREGGLGETGPYYVLHYVAALHWCRLVAMRRDGVFPVMSRFQRLHAHAGRPRWRLVPEGAAPELDVSGSRCRTVPAVPVTRCADADRSVVC